MSDPQTEKLINPLENELPHLQKLYRELLEAVADKEAPDEAVINLADAISDYIKELRTGMLRDVAKWAAEYKRGARSRLAAAS